MTNRIVIEGKAREKISVLLVGTEYTMQPPKNISSFVMSKTVSGNDLNAAMEAVEGYILKAFGEKQGSAIIARMYDDADELDLDQIMTLIEKVAELTTGNPTTSQSV